MSTEGKTIKLCSCNGTLSIDAKAIGAALRHGEPLVVHRELCRREVQQFNDALKEQEVMVACTQEAPLFSELHGAAGSSTELRFFNLREAAGWSAEGRSATPKMAALIAAAALPEPEPVQNVEYKSSGQVLVIGPSGAALAWAERLAGALDPAVLITRGEGGELPAARRYPVWSGRPTKVSGYLGAFEVEWEQSNAIDLELCTRCNACVSACPEGAIDFTYQIDPARCKGHRKCVSACAEIGAIDFSRIERARRETFDMVLDLSPEPLLRVPDLPQGYLAPGGDALEQSLAAAKLAQLVGEFEKPRFFEYNERICAHSRSGRSGCNRCLDVCSTGAITPDGDHIRVEPHLCAGCGGCATVCPSGAIRHVYPGVPYAGRRVKTVLDTYHGAGGRDACILFHDLEAGDALVNAVGRHAVRGGRGLPARVIPLATYHVASIGIDLLLGAICYGASQVAVCATAATPSGYVEALRAQMGIAQSVLGGLGYDGVHVTLIEAESPQALERALWELKPARTVASVATFHLASEKRGTLDFVIDHLHRHAPTPQDLVALPAGSPFGAIEVNKQTCTLCKACVGACPEAALQDAPDTPAIRFIERNCVQCGLCVDTCPEKAITLVPRLLLTAQAKQAVTLNEDEPFNCVRCGKAFGTRRLIESMAGKIGGHSMFAGTGIRRLQMCADCRVVDMMENRGESSVFDYTGRSQ